RGRRGTAARGRRPRAVGDRDRRLGQDGAGARLSCDRRDPLRRHAVPARHRPSRDRARTGAMSAGPARAPAPGVDAAAVREYLLGLQHRIVAGLEANDGEAFRTDAWQRPEGGGGITRGIEEGGVFERGAVLFSNVRGARLPASASAHRAELAGRSFEAMGVSLVIHPRNPYVPTVHLNVRFFVAPGADGVDPVWWFGGGMDLTPYYPFEKDIVRFHSVCRQALAPFGEHWHPRFKKWCDDYFFLKHRNEARGVGGIFFDDLNEPGFERS